MQGIVKVISILNKLKIIYVILPLARTHTEEVKPYYQRSENRK